MEFVSYWGGASIEIKNGTQHFTYMTHNMFMVLNTHSSLAWLHTAA